MIHIKSLNDGLELFKALGSEIRIEIIKILLNNSGMSMNELAAQLNVTNGALTSHIKKLEDCGIVTISSETVGHGNQKICTVRLDKILIDFENQEIDNNIFQTEIKVGYYSDFNVYPTCGLASSTKIIGIEDDTRYFTHPDRYDADILWFTKGYVEYNIPNFIPNSHIIDQITLSLELGSEAPGVNNVWPSDIHFYINNTLIGFWTSPGDFGDMKGIFTPEWWYSNWNQYGLLKLIVINNSGTFIDGLQVSGVTIRDLKLSIPAILKFKIEVPESAKHVGGVTIFGKSFGNYSQDIVAKIHYSPVATASHPKSVDTSKNS